MSPTQAIEIGMKHKSKFQLQQMTFTSMKPSEVLSALHEGALLVTASPRLLAEWKRRLLLGNREEVVATPTLFFWDDWISQLSGYDAASPVPLTKTQELLLWEKVIRYDLRSASPPHHTALKGLARRAAEAYAHMQEYSIDVTELALGGEEAEALARWINAVRSELESNRLQGRALAADMPALIRPTLQQSDLPGRIILDGFEAFTPARLQLLDGFREKGCKIYTVQSDQAPASPTLTPCPDEATELRHLACRIKNLLDRQPLSRIAILTGDSLSDMAALRRELDKALMPEARMNPLCDRQAVTMPGIPLSDWPMIQQTLHLLSLAGKKSIAFSDFSMLLFSPWIRGFEAERMERAALDALFRRQNRHRLSPERLLQSPDIEALPALHAVIQAIDSWTTSSRPASQWVRAVHALLQATGIVQADSNSRPRRSNIEIRQMNLFMDLLTSLVAADVVYTTLSWPQFLSLLQSACSETPLPIAAKYPNVTVMPLAQIAGLSFDHIFVPAMDEQALPPATSPQPLLPLPLQKKYGMPMSHASLQFESSRWLWQQLLRAAPSIETSYAKQQDERELQPSPFVKELGKTEPVDHVATGQAAELETYADAVDMPLQPGENIRGGTLIIKNQSACPFRAFATHRLGISALGETSPGIEPSGKGSLIHLALEHIWKRLRTQAALAALTAEETVALIDAAIRHAWHQGRVPANARTQEYEQKRMRRVLSEWLQMELKRPAFRVTGIEQEYLLQLPETSEQQFTVKIKADRMDEDEFGHRILIDYKTGRKQSFNMWLGERMQEPQLPQYALAAGLGADDAVAFARVRSGDMAYEGLSGEDTGIRGIIPCDGKRNTPDDWQQVLDEWQVDINALAAEFVGGRCDVSPRDARACNYCGLEAVCRVGETGFDCEAEEQEEKT